MATTMDFAPETSPSPETKGIKKVFNKMRRPKPTTDSASSKRSSIDSTNNPSSIDLLPSRGSGEFNNNHNNDNSNGDTSTRASLTKLMSGRRRRKSRAQQAAVADEEEQLARGRSASSRPNVGATLGVQQNNKSVSELSDGGDSLLTDSDAEP